MISNELLQELLGAFPGDSDEIKKCVEEKNGVGLITLLLKSAGVYPSPHFSEEIEAFKEGRFEEANALLEKREKFFSLVMEVAKEL
jgi:hypothetical protein